MRKISRIIRPVNLYQQFQNELIPEIKKELPIDLNQQFQNESIPEIEIKNELPSEPEIKTETKQHINDSKINDIAQESKKKTIPYAIRHILNKKR